MVSLDDEAVKRIAQEILLETAQQIEFPPFVGQEIQDGELTFLVSIRTSNGSAALCYMPQVAVESMVRFFERQQVGDSVPTDDVESQDSLRQLVSYWCRELLIIFIHEYVETTANLPRQAYSQVVYSMMAEEEEMLARREGRTPDMQKIKKMVDKELSLDTRGRRMRVHQFMEGARKRVSPKLELIATFYEPLSPVWKKAKKVFRSHKFSGTEKGWEQFIQNQFSEADLPLGIKELPIDLIERLNPNRSDVDTYSSTPAVIALEHAAELCGARRGEFPRSRLYELLNISKQRLNKVCPSEPEQQDTKPKARKSPRKRISESGRKIAKTIRKSAS